MCQAVDVINVLSKLASTGGWGRDNQVHLKLDKGERTCRRVVSRFRAKDVEEMSFEHAAKSLASYAVSPRVISLCGKERK